MKALVIGITGQDGSYLAEFLLEKGYEVHGIIRRSSSFNTSRLDDIYQDPHEPHRRLHLHYGDLNDASSLNRILRQVKPDEIYNLGAQSHVRTSFDIPEYTAEVTGLGALRLFEAAKDVCPEAKIYQACHDEETLAVTPDGVKCYNDLKIGDELFVFNTSSRSVEIKKIKKIHIYNHNGNMISIKGRRLNQMVTPNHKILLKLDKNYLQENGYFKNSNLQYIGNDYVYFEAKSIQEIMRSERISFLSLPLAEQVLGREDEFVDISEFVDLTTKTDNTHKNLINKIKTKDFFYLLGLYLGDGYTKNKKTALVKYKTDGEDKRTHDKLGRFTFSNKSSNIKREYVSNFIQFAVPRKDKARKRLVETLKRLGLNFNPKEITVDLSSFSLSRVFNLCNFGKDDLNRKRPVYLKRIPNFAWLYGKIGLQALYEGLIDSDGCWREANRINNIKRAQFTTVSQGLFIDFIRLCTVLGKYCSYAKVDEQKSVTKDGREIKTSGPTWLITINSKTTNKIYKTHFSNINHNGNVWCAEVEGVNPNFLVSRGGKIFFSGNSSSELFGSSPPPQNEQTPFQPRSPYAIAKLHAFWTAVNYRESYNMHISNGILFNHESSRRSPTFVTRKVTQAAARIRLGKLDKLFLGNLEAKRDWGFAGDYVEAMHLMLQQEKPDDYVIATGETHSVREWVEAVFGYHNLDWKQYVEIDPRYFRPTEVDALSGDASKAKRILKWEPRVKFAELAEMMAKADYEIEMKK